MELKELVAAARQKDQEFDKKMSYWLETKRKDPGLEWLMPKLEAILGKKYVQNAARSQILKEPGDA